MGEMKVGVEGKRLFEEFSAGYYGLCTVGGMLSAGTPIWPSLLLMSSKFICNMPGYGVPYDFCVFVWVLSSGVSHVNVNPVKYHSISSGFSTLWKEQGPSSLWRGWSGKFFGYGVQGGCKFGLYEYFKKLYSGVLVDQNKSTIFFVSSASAQVFADWLYVHLKLLKSVFKHSHILQRAWPMDFRNYMLLKGFLDFTGDFIHFGVAIYHTMFLTVSMVMFTTFEHSVDYIYCHVIQRRKEDCSRAQQLGVTCLAGYAAGAVGTILSNPADNIVSTLNNRKAETVRQAVKDIGLVNLFTRSLPIRMTLVGPVVTMQWFFYDTIKVLSGLCFPLLGSPWHSAKELLYRPL
ncbi:hypothetical protein RHSIM_Rhsim05G0046500 [Rhododendron simsii]|uniref:Uncharacterized protein n=1 Tax=Rhododendron simsii TaxID=118357 RepID=A0A834GY43_RHOSS|nr:hypothetical protein RHSIM_Rhsim05G0046500 [Rhododendron simsii]